MRKKRKLSVTEDLALSRLEAEPGDPEPLIEYDPSPRHWIQILRTYLRMTQAELAKRAKVSKAHLIGIEKGKIDPGLGTLKRIFGAMGCDVSIRPEPRKLLREILRGRARAVALKSLKQVMGTMALEVQAPGSPEFKRLLEKRTDEILADKRISLSKGKND